LAANTKHDRVNSDKLELETTGFNDEWNTTRLEPITTLVEGVLFFDPFYGGVGSAAGGGGVVVVGHETEIVDVDMRIEE
jgi:hypothetical protein